MLRSVVLGVANRKAVRSAVTGGMGRRVALRFVAGEEIGDALAAITRLNATGADVSVDYLGENVTDLEQAKAAVSVYLTILDRVEAETLRANVSVKLTQVGLDVDAAAAHDNAAALVERAARAGTSVTLDMEDHRYTDRTIDACLRLHEQFPGKVGLAVQAYLRRTPEDLARLTAAGVHIRLCKGAYKEPRAIAYRARDDVDAAFARLTNQLLASPSYAMIATHDDRLIRHAIETVRTLERAPGTYEFQMLYGVRRELQRELIARREQVRVYVPFGGQWYPYLMRRIAERPGNMRFFAEALLRK